MFQVLLTSFQFKWPLKTTVQILNRTVNSPSRSNSKKVFHLGISKNYCDSSRRIPGPFHCCLDHLTNLVGPAFNLLSHSRNLCTWERRVAFTFLVGKRIAPSQTCIRGNGSSHKSCKSSVGRWFMVLLRKDRNNRNTTMVTVGSNRATAFEYFYFRQFKIHVF